MATNASSNHRSVFCFTYLMHKYELFNEQKVMMPWQVKGENGGKGIESSEHCSPLCRLTLCLSHTFALSARGSTVEAIWLPIPF